MEDLRLIVSACDHKVSEEIQVEGISPNYFSILPYQSNKSVVATTIREFGQTDGLTFFDNTIDGITNFEYSVDGTQINFGVYPVDATMNFPDPNPAYIPAKVYTAEYTTLKDPCPKCSGTGLVKDINYNVLGRLTTVSGKNKVVQQILKVLLTVTGENLFDSAYGSALSASIGKKIDAYIAAKLNQSILDALNHLMSIQQVNGVPDTERIVRVADVIATRNPNDARMIHIEVIVTLATFDSVSTKLGIQL